MENRFGVSDAAEANKVHQHISLVYTQENTINLE